MGKPRAGVLTIELLESRSLPSVLFSSTHLPMQPMPGDLATATVRRSQDQMIPNLGGPDQVATPPSWTDFSIRQVVRKDGETSLGLTSPTLGQGQTITGLTGQDEDWSPFQGYGDLTSHRLFQSDGPPTAITTLPVTPTQLPISPPSQESGTAGAQQVLQTDDFAPASIVPTAPQAPPLTFGAIQISAFASAQADVQSSDDAVLMDPVTIAQIPLPVQPPALIEASAPQAGRYAPSRPPTEQNEAKMPAFDGALELGPPQTDQEDPSLPPGPQDLSFAPSQNTPTPSLDVLASRANSPEQQPDAAAIPPALAGRVVTTNASNTTQSAVPSSPVASATTQFGQVDRSSSTQSFQANNSTPLANNSRDDGALRLQNTTALLASSVERREVGGSLLPYSTGPITQVEPEGIGAVTQPGTTRADVDFDPVPASYTAVLASGMPANSLNLGSSIKDFFDKVDQLGIKLTESQVDMLYSSGILAVAAAVAFELVRRQARPVAPALVQGRRNVPFSTYT